MNCELSINARRTVAWLLCLGSVMACAGQTKDLAAIHYSGRITDNSTGRPIEAARIKFVPSAFGSEWRTDATGRFSFWASGKTDHQIEIEREGYQPLWLSSDAGSFGDIRLEPQAASVSGPTGISASGSQTEIMSPSQAVAPAFATAESGPRLSGSGRSWSRWYRLEMGKAPNGYTLYKAEFWLSGDRACGQGAQCREIMESNQGILWEFRLQGHEEMGAPPRASTAHIRAIYRAK